ncbi:hypothetical protein J0895_08935 [Phormidium pseudopriestleyi FRX01]|uniref:Uncharacterized protein n=1 Tax=Phormidium pseudopriestleyi FRX01 TaxID=1759528 RepID=A0ABS3FRI9_9CYAN|nr:hypothetical protein [Phormidium pseudopriestleyi]MBO0349226.1 hypothetical protein [Phormidium pseudopriestleyi FRX01]
MSHRLIAAIAFLSLACVGCDSNPLAKQLPGSSPAATQSPTVTQSYDLQLNQSEIVVRLTEVALAEDSTTLTLSITNGRREVIEIDTEKNPIVISDDKYNKYNLAIPPDNPLIQIPSGTTLNGKFVFIGRLLPEVNTIRLRTLMQWTRANSSSREATLFNMYNIEISKTPDNVPTN